ncbi:MAG: hypothetical protein ACYDAB_13445 [bacterium]
MNVPAAERPTASASEGAAGGPLAFTFGTWFTWTAVGIVFPALGLTLLAAAGPLAQGAYESAPAFAATHLATLAWGTLTILGAAAQMAPVLLGARVRGERTIPWLYLVFAASTAVVLAGLAGGRYDIAAAGGAGINLAAWWFIAVLAATAVSAGPKRAVLSPHIPAALVCFALVSLWGTVLAANLRWVFWPGILIGHRGLVVHMTLGLGGWFGLMVVGVFYRLVPLVHGARVASARRGAAILLAGVVAIASALGGAAFPSVWFLRAAALLSAGALVLFAAEIVHVLAHRRGRAPDLNVAHWSAVAFYSIVLAAIGAGWAAGVLRTDPPDRLGEVTVMLFLLGWVTQAIVGQLYKITPFLMWYHRATIPDVLAIPRQPAPYNPRPGRLVLWLSNLGVTGMAAGIWIGAPAAAQTGAALLTAGAFILAYMLAYRWVPPAVTKTLVFEWRRRIS